MKTTLIIGGARSGKSTLAQDMAMKAGGNVLFVATAEAGDEDMKKRIEMHRKSRPSSWTTLEVTRHVGSQINKNKTKVKTVIIDCITLLVNNIFIRYDENTDADLALKEVTAEIKALLGCIDRSDAHFIIVTNEVGLGIVPADRVSRIYRDMLGRANQMLADYADEVLLLVAGIPLTLKSSDR